MQTAAMETALYVMSELRAKIATSVSHYKPRTGKPSPNDIADEILELIAAHDQTLKQKLLAALPKEREKPFNENNQGEPLASAHGSQTGHNNCLSDATQAIEQVFGDE